MLGRTLDGRYRIEDRIARGGMATVYTATDTRLDRVVALKIMHEGLGSDEDFADRFVHEARAAARLNHPHVVAVFDQGEDDGTVYLVMEYVPGHTLRDLIRAEAPMPARRALGVLDQILTALAAAHEAGLIHRDIKPENVLIMPTGQVKVADFGLARAVSSSTAITATAGVLVGTVSYVAPELVLHEGTDARADVYACGVLLYEMLTGRKPHEADTPIQVAYKHVHEDVPPPSALIPGLPSYVDALVSRTTARDRDQRPPDARVMLRHVRRVAAALDQGHRDDEQLTQDLALRHQPRPADDDWNAFLFESAATDIEHTAVTPVQPPKVPSTPGFSGAQVGTGPPGRRRRRRGPIMLVVLLLLATAAGLAGWQLAVGQYTDTPALVGLRLEEAEATAEAEGLGVTVQASAYSETVPEGEVMSTTPAGGERIVEEGTVELVVSLGKERYEVPDVERMPAADARQDIEGANLTVGEEKERYSGRFEAGQVIKVSPDAGTLLRPDAQVDLTLSLGPRPLEIPDTTGETVRAATKRLEAVGFTVSLSEEYDDEVVAGRVIAQDPVDGTGFKGDEVALVVSLGPELVEVPNVLAQGVVAATEELEAAGFVVEEGKADPYLGLGYVAEQDPAGGASAPFGSTITLFLV